VKDSTSLHGDVADENTGGTSLSLRYSSPIDLDQSMRESVLADACRKFPLKSAPSAARFPKQSGDLNVSVRGHKGEKGETAARPRLNAILRESGK